MFFLLTKVFFQGLSKHYPGFQFYNNRVLRLYVILFIVLFQANFNLFLRRQFTNFIKQTNLYYHFLSVIHFLFINFQLLSYYYYFLFVKIKYLQVLVFIFSVIIFQIIYILSQNIINQKIMYQFHFHQNALIFQLIYDLALKLLITLKIHLFQIQPRIENSIINILFFKNKMNKQSTKLNIYYIQKDIQQFFI
ncbi:hypothetical protein IMG5_072980 [Ichthyophthirius multifiliis]|uniref:Transmembrane protein n=1 Tax=Ichthyophthirius multifiliis TaxID=5932 RepID=G0QPY5_ICHMU|nr:hypothetical protein IMG5_072980 [Ichthyophthirius multifiliis]EGR32720.1 hypothetical protein IMG5_072980 [Ichthyophthirius multifiliis]|eukprot:XP_004036706.1 hypothetical protein IMG5_072980 [Ichthyophthirius multifiliis]